MKTNKLVKLFLCGLLFFANNLYAYQKSNFFNSAEEEWPEDDWAGISEKKIEWHGFAEGAAGSRLESSDISPSSTLEDLRLRLESNYIFYDINFTVKGDIYYDGISDSLDSNQWHSRFRELSLERSFLEKFDVKVGRQILTWGTGDYLFLNDLFPKDWQSFFSGRDDEYLKAPSDAIKLSGYFNVFNVDLVWTPRFDSDIYINGEYFSFFNPWEGEIVMPKPSLFVLKPDGDEWAVRLFKNINGTEFAFYGYDGFYKSPLLTFSKLLTLGASVRRTLGNGLFNFEVSHHTSKQDKQGDNPRIPNSQWLALIGYEVELASRLTGGFQYYIEHTEKYSAQLNNSPFKHFENKQNRSVLTTRLTYRNSADDLTLSLFMFYSPSEQDFHLRPSGNYRINDSWKMSAGINVFGGKKENSFFSQFEDNNNAWVRMRYSF